MMALPMRSAICSGSESVCAAGLGDQAYTTSPAGVARAASCVKSAARDEGVRGRSILDSRRAAACARPLDSSLDDGKLLTLRDVLALLDQDRRDLSSDRRDDRNLHLHRLHDEERFLLLDRLAGLHDDLPHLARDVRPQLLRRQMTVPFAVVSAMCSTVLRMSWASRPAGACRCRARAGAHAPRAAGQASGASRAGR